MNRILILLAALGLALPALAQSRQRYTIVTDGAPAVAARRIASNADGAHRVRTYSNLNGFAADLTEEEVAELRKTAGVTAVQPVVPRYATSLESVPANLNAYAKQVMPWGLTMVRGADVWKVTRGENVNVAVIDTGIDATHPDLTAAYVGGYNVLEPAKPPIDDNRHGTHVSGTIAATNNDFGIVGVAPGVRLWAVKALDAAGKGYDEGIAGALDWVISKEREIGGRWVVNMSFSAGAEGGNLERVAIVKALERNIVLVAAAGNNSTTNVEYPARYPGVIAVGAVSQNGLRADFSAYGGQMAIVAPGVEMPSTLPNGIREEADVTVGTETFRARGLIGSPKAQLSGKIIFAQGGHPQDFPASVKNNIALIARDRDLTFREKARNAKIAGAKAVIVYDDEETPNPMLFTLLPRGCPGPDCEPEWNDYQFPLTVNVRLSDGLKLKALADKDATVAFEFARYGAESGTSMAAPHVSGVAALILSLDPALSPLSVLNVMRNTAHDTAEPGWDYETAWGIVDALAAGQWVAPDKFNVPPPPTTSRRRSARP
jgi:serine protease